MFRTREMLKGKRILVVDDCVNMRELYSSIFKKVGAEVIAAGDGEEGFALARRMIPDMVIMDIVMPRMNGIDVGRMLRNCRETRHIPIMFASSYDSLLSRLSRDPVLADACLPKPFNASQLLEKAVQVIGGERD